MENTPAHREQLRKDYFEVRELLMNTVSTRDETLKELRRLDRTVNDITLAKERLFEELRHATFEDIL